MALLGKVAVVVAGAAGMGRAVCEILLENGCKVVMGDIRCEDTLLSGWREQHGADCAVYQHCDVQSQQQIDDLFKLAKEKYQKIDIVYSHAGILNEKDFLKCIDINLTGHVRVANTALTHMSREHGGGGGVFIATSSNGGLRPFCIGPVYCGTKAGVIQWIRCWAEPDNYHRTGVRFNAICPTGVDTNFLTEFIKPGNVVNYEWMVAHRDNTTKLTPRFVAEGALKLILNDEANGKALRCSDERGYDYASFEEAPLQ